VGQDIDLPDALPVLVIGFHAPQDYDSRIGAEKIDEAEVLFVSRPDG
jgi:hypothetical protein